MVSSQARLEPDPRTGHTPGRPALRAHRGATGNSLATSILFLKESLESGIIEYMLCLS